MSSEIELTGLQRGETQSPGAERPKDSGSGKQLSFLSDVAQRGAVGNVCVKISSISQSVKSRSGWEYRRFEVKDKSMSAEMLISETAYAEWQFAVNDSVICGVKSNGLDSEGRLSVFFNGFLGPFDSADILYGLSSEMYELKSRSGEHMKSNETVYQISAREIVSLLRLIQLWVAEGKPQHYTKWCQMHQIVATNLYYMGLVKRTRSMSGDYYPTSEALDFFEGKRDFPKKKVFARGKDGKHIPIGEEGESRSFLDYLSDYADRDSALKEYREALGAYKNRAGSEVGVQMTN
jgi:hypothetical protein